MKNAAQHAVRPERLHSAALLHIVSDADLQTLCFSLCPSPSLAPGMKGMKKVRSEVKKVGPLKMAALNGLTLSRMPLPDEGKDDPENTSNDERVRTAFTLTAGWGNGS